MHRPLPPWLTRGVRGIGLASLLSDFGHEIPTALLPSLLTSVLGAPAAALGLIEGVADAMSGVAKIAGGALADDPARRRSIAVGGYTLAAILSALIGVAGAVWQVAILRTGAWVARGVRGPARNALLADAVEPSQFGRAYGFERSMDNAGAIGGPIIAILLVSLVGIRGAIPLSVIPGLLAVLAIVYAVRHLAKPTRREHAPVRLVVRPLLRGPLGRCSSGSRCSRPATWQRPYSSFGRANSSPRIADPMAPRSSRSPSMSLTTSRRRWPVFRAATWAIASGRFGSWASASRCSPPLMPPSGLRSRSAGARTGLRGRRGRDRRG